MEIKIKYNTISFESQIECNDKDISENLQQTINDIKGKRITDWLKLFIKKAKEETNNESFLLKVSGCDVYEADYIKELINEEQDIEIKMNLILDNKQIQTSYKNINDFLSYAQESENDIIKSAIEPNVENIKKYKSTKIEVPVIATMSSGKSTLLNALIGQDFLHEDTGATTATTCDIIVNNKLNHFIAKSFCIENEKKVEKDVEKENISAVLKSWNAKANEDSSLRLELEGPVQNLNTSKFALNFIDTPGPNSSNHSHHKEKTYNYLKDNRNLPIVLYVLDPEKIDSKDDDSTLSEISKVLKDNGQNLDRIAFVYNKIDREDIEEKSISAILEKVESFLAKYGIKNAKIFPVSAQYAKFAQIEKSLKRNQKSDLNLFRSKFRPDDSYLGYELLKHAPLTTSQKELLTKKIDRTVLDADLVYSGLAALTLYIEDYIVNHHQKNLYKELQTIVNWVSKQIETEIQLKKERLEELSEEEQNKKQEKQNEEIVQLNKKKEEAFEEISKLKINDKIANKILKEINNKFNNLKNKAFQNKELSQDEAKQLIDHANEIIKNLQVSIKTDLISNMKDEIERYLADLKKIASNKFSLDKVSLESAAFNAEMGNSINTINIERLSDYEEDKVEEKEREVESDWWIKRLFNWKVTEKYFDVKTIVKVDELYKDVIDPYSSKFNKLIEDYKDYFDNKMEHVKNEFIDIIECEFKKIRDHVFENHMISISKDKKLKEQKVKEFDGVLDSILKFKI